MLCTQTDVEQRLQIEFGNPAEPVIVNLIEAAQGHIEREVGRPIEDAAYVETFDGPIGPYLWLSKTPVNTVATVTVDGTLLTVTDDYFFVAETGKLGRVSNGHYRYWDSPKVQVVVVEYNGGWVTPPADLIDVCAWAAARAFQAGAAYAALPEAAAGGGVESISLAGSDAVAFTLGAGGGLATSSVTRPVQLTQEEIELCRSYRLRRFGFA